MPYLSALGATVADCPALFIMTSRVEGEPLDPGWRGAMRSAALTTVELAPMRGEDSLRLAGSILGEEDERAHRCAELAHGNPLFIEQLARAGGDARSLPDSVQSVVWWRLDQLPPLARGVAQAASILGQRFPRETLQELSAADEESLHALVAQRLLRAEGDHYAFAHALVREGVYASLLRAEREKLHKRAARWYESRDPVLAAEHLEAARDPEAAPAYHRAASHYADLYRHDRAVDLARRGLAVAAGRAQRLQLGLLLGQVLRAGGRAEESLQAYARAQQEAGSDSERGHALMGRVAALRLLDRHEEALAVLELAEQALGESASARDRARISHYRGRLLFPLGHIEECLMAEEAALRLAREARSPSLQASALSGIGDAWYQRGRIFTARVHFDRCVALAREHGFGRIEVTNLTMRGHTRCYELDLTGAEADLLACMEMAERAGDQRAEMLTTESLAMLACWRKQPGAGLRWAERALELASGIGARRFVVGGWCWKATAHIMLGEIAAARAAVAEAEAIADEAGASYCRPHVLAVQTALAADIEECRERVERACEFLDAGSVSHNHFYVYAAAIERSLELSAWDTAAGYADALARYTEPEPLPWSDLLIARSRALAARGRDPAGFPARRLHALAERIRAADLLSLLPAVEKALAQTS